MWDFTSEQLRTHFTYEPSTGLFKWNYDANGRCKKKKGDIAGSILTMSCGKKYVRLTAKGVYMMAHRAAFLWMHGFLPEEVDHKNGDGCDNRISNLRESNRKLNAKNLKQRVDNSSGETGVSWDKSRSKWMAHIHINGKMKNLGRFDDKESAIQTRRKAMTEYGYYPEHGEIKNVK